MRVINPPKATRSSYLLFVYWRLLQSQFVLTRSLPVLLKALRGRFTLLRLLRLCLLLAKEAANVALKVFPAFSHSPAVFEAVIFVVDDLPASLHQSLQAFVKEAHLLEDEPGSGLEERLPDLLFLEVLAELISFFAQFLPQLQALTQNPL